MHNYFFGEFLGTMSLTLLGCGVNANMLLKRSKGEGGGWICITAGWAFAVIFGVFIAQASGSPQADLNPAVTIGKYFLGVYACCFQVFLQIIAQLIGAFVGAAIIWLAYFPHWQETADKGHKLGVFATSPAIVDAMSNFTCEVIGTFVLVLCIGALVTNAAITSGLVPYFVGVLVWSIGLSLGGPTGYALNPARDLGPRLAHAILPIHDKGSSEWSYAWIPIVGPIVGATLGVAVWSLVFIK